MKDIKIVPLLLGLLSFLMSSLIALLVYIWIDHKSTTTARNDKMDSFLEKMTDKIDNVQDETIRQASYDLVQDGKIHRVECDVNELKLDVKHLKRKL